jgi:hypothetical protein
MSHREACAEVAAAKGRWAANFKAATEQLRQLSKAKRPDTLGKRVRT